MLDDSGWIIQQYCLIHGIMGSDVIHDVMVGKWFPHHWPFIRPHTHNRPVIWSFDVFVYVSFNNPDNKVHGANMGPNWVLSAPDGPHAGPVNLAIREVVGPTLELAGIGDGTWDKVASTTLSFINCDFSQCNLRSTHQVFAVESDVYFLLMVVNI